MKGLFSGPAYSRANRPDIVGRSPFFYGWVIVGVSALAWLVVFPHQNVLSVLLEPMSTDLGWTKTQMVGALSVGAIASGFASMLIGPLIDRFGARVPMALATLLGGAVVLAVSRLDALWQFYLLYGVLFGALRPAILDLATGTAIANWFVRMRGRAFAISLLASPVGTAILVPLAQYIVTHQGWRQVWVTLALLMWLLVFLPVTLLMRRRPEDMGLSPDGAVRATAVQRADTQTVPSEPPGEEWTAREAVRTRAFWLIIVAMTLSGAMSGPAAMLFMVPYLTSKGLSPATAALATSVFAMGVLGARVMWGLLVERIHVRRVFMLYGVGASSGALLLILSPAWPLAVFAAAAYFGLFMGGAAVVFNVMWPTYFGRLAIGAIRGYSAPFMALGSAGSPLLVAFIYDTTLSYRFGYALFVAWYFSSAMVVYFARPPVRSRSSRAAVAAENP
ncbi:MAG: MFS transporter [Chloroflexi bacterium]|nr:MFS transporter [Chloroflexota bacterium]